MKRSICCGGWSDHASNTACYNIWYGEDRDAYDVAGRTAHESLFNATSGDYRCPSTQQGYSPFSTWTRGPGLGDARFRRIAGVARHAIGPRAGDSRRPGGDRIGVCPGGASHVELLHSRDADRRRAVLGHWRAGLAQLGDYLERPADPFNDFEPVDSSAAAIAAQGLLRLGHYLVHYRGETADGVRYVQAGLTVLNTLLGEPYLSTDVKHQGLILHSVYHRPNGWDHVPAGRKMPCGESSMWGDYHAREVALYVQRLAEGGPYYTFFGPTTEQEFHNA